MNTKTMIRISAKWLGTFILLGLTTTCLPQNKIKYPLSNRIYSEAESKMSVGESKVAGELFASAFHLYKKEKNYERMNDCLFALATLEVQKQQITNGLNLLYEARKNHLKFLKNDTARLRILDETIRTLTNLQNRTEHSSPSNSN